MHATYDRPLSGMGWTHALHLLVYHQKAPRTEGKGLKVISLWMPTSIMFVTYLIRYFISQYDDCCYSPNMEMGALSKEYETAIESYKGESIYCCETNMQEREAHNLDATTMAWRRSLPAADRCSCSYIPMEKRETKLVKLYYNNIGRVWRRRPQATYKRICCTVPTPRPE
jgi:hypothetical protein